MKTKVLQASSKALCLLRSRWLMAGLLLTILVGSGWWIQGYALAASADPVRAAWQAARALGAYQFSSDLTQVTTPLATLNNVGSTSRQIALHLEGASDLRKATMNLRLWTQDSSPNLANQPNNGIEVRVVNGKTQMRQIDDADPLKGWKDTGDVLGGIAPGGDFLSFLAGLRDIRALGTESRSGITFARYAFQLDGPTIANHVRDQMEAALRQQGKLPPGLELQAPSSYAEMSGSGELWVDSRGLPLRQILDLQFPAQRDEVVTAHIVTDFSHFAQGASIAWLSPDAVRSAASSSLALTLGLAFAAVVVVGRRWRRLYAALAIALIFAEVSGPLLQNFNISSFMAAQSALAATQDQQQSQDEMLRKASDMADQQRFDPQVDPVQRANAEDALAATTSDALPPAPTPEPVTAPDNGVDSDHDGLTDYVEQRIGTDPSVADTDGDQIPDGAEVLGFDYGGHHWFGDPLQADSNSDGLPDTVEWHNQRDGLPLDTDGDGIPDAFDDDNDGDGVPDQYDLSPFTKMTPSNASFFNEATPLQFQLSNLQPGNPVFVDFQVRPRNDKHLWYALSVLDWPQDVEGQIQDGDGKTFADLPGSDPNVSPSDRNGDMKLVPMLEIRTPTASANLPSQQQLTAYGVAAHKLTSDGANQVIYVPLRLTFDTKTGARLAFSGRMPYLAGNNWSQPHQIRLVWLVQALLDSCSSQVDGQCVAYTSTNRPSVIQSYYDDWTLTGLAVREDHGAQTALIFEDPAHDADLKDDSGLVKLAFGLEHSFLAGRDQDNNNQADVTIANISGAPARWGITNLFQFVQGTYNSFDDAVMTTAVSTTKTMLDRNFLSAWNNDHDLKPLMLFAHEESYRSQGLDGLLTGGATQQQGALLKIDFNAPSAPVQEQTSVGMKWTMFCRDPQSATWQGCEATTIWDDLYTRYADSARLTIDGQTDSPVVAQARMGLIRLYFLALVQGVTSIVKDAGKLVPGGLILDDAISSKIRGAGNGGKGVVAFITSLATTKIELLSNDLIYQIARLGAPKLVAGLGIGGLVSTRVLTRIKLIWAQYDRAKFGIIAGIVGVVLVTLTIAAVLLYYLYTHPGERSAAQDFVVNKVVPIVGVVVPLVSLAASVVPLVQLARGLELSVGAQGALPKLLRGSSALVGTARIALVVGTVIQLAVVWGIFIYQMVSTNTAFFSPQFNAALAQTIAATVIIVTLAVLSATVIGLIVVGVIALIDAILTAVCELGVDALRKVPGLNGACFTLNTAATAGLAKLIYSFDSMINTDRDDIVTSAGPTFTLADPTRGFVAGNPISIGLGVTTTVVHKDPKPENVIHILPYIWLFSEDNIRGTTFSYELAQHTSDLQAERHQMDNAWSVSEDHRYAGKTMYRAQAFSIPQANSINLPVGLNQSPGLYLNTGYALPAYECWSTLGLARVCYVRTLDGHNSTSISQLKLDILPASLDGFMAMVDAGKGGFKLGWDSHFTTLADADGDGLQSMARQGNDPNDSTWDADGDGLADSLELAWRENGTPVSPLTWDTDGDGLSDAQELALGTDPTLRDTDNDGLADGEEVYHQVYTFDTATGKVKPTNTWSGGWTVTIPGTQPLTQIVSSDPTSADTDGDGISDKAEKELATSADPSKRLDPDGRPYNPLIVNKNPLLVQVAVNDTDRIVKPGQNVVYSTTVTNMGAPLVAGGLEVRAPAELGTPYSTYRLDLDQSNVISKATTFVVGTVPSQNLTINSFARARLANPNASPWSWQPPTFSSLGSSTTTRFNYAAVTPNSLSRQDAYAVTAVSANTSPIINIPNRNLSAGDLNGWSTADGASAILDQDSNNTTALRTPSASDVACNNSGRCFYAWDQYLSTGSAQHNIIVAAITNQNPSQVQNAQFVLTQNPSDAQSNDYQPVVASDGSNFLVAWERVTQDHNTPGVMYSQLVTRLYKADGTPLQDEQVFAAVHVSNVLFWNSYQKLDVAWIGQAYRLAMHENDSLSIFDFNSAGVYFGFEPIADNLATYSWPRLAYDPVDQRTALAYVDNAMQMHLVFFNELFGNAENDTYGTAYDNALEITYHPGLNDWLMAWRDPNTQQLTYQLLKPSGVTDFTMGTQFYAWPVAPTLHAMNLSCPAVTSQPVLHLPFEELPGATTFVDSSVHATNASCSGDQCPLAGVQGAPQAPYSDYGVLFDSSKKQTITAATPGISGGAFSIAFWYKINGHNAMPLVSGDGWYLAFFPGILYFKTFDGAAVRANIRTDDGQWHHVVIAYNNAFGTLFLDGQQAGLDSVNQLTLPSPANLHIGSLADNSAFFNGEIDDLVVYPTALDASAVDNLYHRRLDSACFVVAPAVNTFGDENSANDIGMVETARLNLVSQDSRGGVIQANAGLSLTVDADAPTSAIDSLTNNSYLQGTPGGSQTLIIGGSANDANGIQRVNVRVNGGQWLPATGAATWVYPLQVSEGRYTLQSQAVDVAGNMESNPASTTILVDAKAPQITTGFQENATVTPVSPAIGQWNVSLDGTANDPAIAGNPGSGVQQVDVLLQSANFNDSGNGWQPATLQANHWSVNYSLPSAPALSGVYTVTVRAGDLVGNQATLSRHLKLDQAGPSAVLNAMVSTVDTLAKSAPVVNAASVSSSAALTTPVQIDGMASDDSGVAAVEAAFVPIQRIRAFSDTLLFLPFDESSDERIFHDISPMHTDVSCAQPCGAGQPGQNNKAIHMIANQAGPIERQQAGEFDFGAKSSFSVQSWLRTSQKDGVILSKEDARNIGFALLLQAGNVALRLNNRVVAQSKSAINDNKWHQIVGVVDASIGQAQLYVDGVLVSKDSFSSALFDPAHPNSPLVIGGKAKGDLLAGTIDGWFDDVGVFNAALSPFLVQALFHTEDTIRQPATLDQPGAASTHWSVVVPNGLEGQYQVDLTLTDNLANQALQASVWRGVIDTLAPRITFTAEATGARFDDGKGTARFEIAYSYSAEDRYLSDTNFSGPCQDISAVVRDFADDADVAGLFPDLTLRNRLSTSCNQWESSLTPTTTVSACDQFGDCSTATAEKAANAQAANVMRTNADGGEPSALLLQPTNHSILALEGDQLLTVTVLAKADAGLRSVSFLLDGKPLQSLDFGEKDAVKTTQQTVALKLSGFDLNKLEGKHTLVAQASDWAGNEQKTLFPSTVTFDTHDPVVDLANDKLTSADGYSLGNSIMRLHGNASDSLGLAAVQISTNNGPFMDVTFDDQGNWSTALWLGDEPAGQNYTFQVRAIDRAGHQTLVSKKLLVDVPPIATLQTTITAGPEAITKSTSATFSFNGVDAAGHALTAFQCQLDGSAFTPCRSPQSYKGLDQGEHIFRVLGSDGKGTIDPTPAERIWQIGDAPTIPPVTPPVTQPTQGHKTIFLPIITHPEARTSDAGTNHDEQAQPQSDNNENIDTDQNGADSNEQTPSMRLVLPLILN